MSLVTRMDIDFPRFSAVRRASITRVSPALSGPPRSGAILRPMLERHVPDSYATREDFARDEMPAPAPQAVAEGGPNFRSTLKLRLSLLITSLLAVLTLSAGAYVVHKARDDIRDEAQSTLSLTGHFMDAQIEVMRERWAAGGYSAPQFKLHELGDIRHLSVKYYDSQDRLLDGNAAAHGRALLAPRWFASLIPLNSALLQTQIREVSFNGRLIGRLVIAPDPSYETDEMWTTSAGLLELLLSFFIIINGLVWWAASRAMRPVERILQALAQLRAGHLDARLPHFSSPELSRISVGFNHMAQALELSVSENQRLTRRLLNTQENERTRLARELHDEIGQSLSAIHADAAAIRNAGGETVRESAEAIVAVTVHIKNIVRSMLQRLRPPVMEGLGLTPALRELVAGFQQRNPAVVCTLRSTGDLLDVDQEVAVAVYRVVQECLTNIAAHANARHAAIEVSTARGDEACIPRRIDVQVADDGAGFFLMSTNRGFGLTGIRERVKALGGACIIETHPGRGTRVSITVPTA